MKLIRSATLLRQMQQLQQQPMQWTRAIKSTYLVGAVTGRRHFASSTDHFPTIPTQQQQKEKETQTKDRVERLQAAGAQLLNEGDISGALAKFQTANSESISPNPSLLYNIGVCHYQLGDMDTAIDHWKQSLELDPSHADIHVNLASALVIYKQDHKGAIEHLRIAADLAPNDGEVFYNHGCLLEASGQIEAAIDKYRTAQKLGIEKAEQHIRNAGAKLMASKLKEMNESNSDGKQ
ncbi:TPR-like protein [Ramicandelaber brevisporus]|nr:TPR-like protein [Ramicandelaber brevisporus]